MGSDNNDETKSARAAPRLQTLLVGVTAFLALLLVMSMSNSNQVVAPPLTSNHVRGTKSSREGNLLAGGNEEAVMKEIKELKDKIAEMNAEKMGIFEELHNAAVTALRPGQQTDPATPTSQNAPSSPTTPITPVTPVTSATSTTPITLKTMYSPSNPLLLYPSTSASVLSNPNSKVVDFSCPLRDYEEVSKCQLKCKDTSCSRAKTICSHFLECTHVVYSGEQNTDMTGQMVTLMHQVAEEGEQEFMDYLSPWIEKNTISFDIKPRTYVIISYGGSGSKMLSGWISDLDKSLVVKVRHMHDPNPPKVMREFNKPLAETSHQQDYRNRHIPGGHFPRDTALISPADYDNYRYIYIFKEPVEGLVSRYGPGHCEHVGGDCGPADSFPKLDEYAAAGRDFFRITDFFDAYTTPDPSREYPIICLNYHKLWDNIPSVVKALGFPPEVANTFPKRTETVRNDATGAREGNAAHTEETRGKLREMYKHVREKIMSMPATSVS